MTVDLRPMLASKATDTIPGRDYNAHRRILEERDLPTLFFESALPLEGTAPAIADKVMPSFVRFMASHHIDLDRPRGVTVALFLGELCYLLTGETFLDLYLELEGVDRAAFGTRARGWI